MLSTSSLACARSGKASSKADPRTMYKSFRDADASYVIFCVLPIYIYRMIEIFLIVEQSVKTGS